MIVTLLCLLPWSYCLILTNVIIPSESSSVSRNCSPWILRFCCRYSFVFRWSLFRGCPKCETEERVSSSQRQPLTAHFALPTHEFNTRFASDNRAKFEPRLWCHWDQFSHSAHSGYASYVELCLLSCAFWHLNKVPLSQWSVSRTG